MIETRCSFKVFGCFGDRNSQLIPITTGTWAFKKKLTKIYLKKINSNKTSSKALRIKDYTDAWKLNKIPSECVVLHNDDNAQQI